MSSTNTLAPFQAFMEDGRPRCRCRVWRGGTGPQCGNPAKNDGICGTHWCVVERGSLPIAGFYDKPRPRIWGEELNGNFHQVPEDAKAGDTIPWKSNVTETREDTPEPCDAGDTSVKDMDHLAQAQAQERLHELGVPRMLVAEEAEEAWTEAEKAFADLEAELDAQPQLTGIYSRWAQDQNPVAESVPENGAFPVGEIPQVSVTCIRPNAKIKNKAPEDSKYRQEYSISIGDAKREFNCWHWWRDPMDGVIRFLGGGSGTSKIPTIYRVEVKGNGLSFKRDEDQSNAKKLYNKYGRK